MKKETLIAIIFGIILGLGGAIIIVSRAKQISSSKVIPGNVQKTIPNSTNKLANIKALEILSPTESALLQKNSVMVKGRTNKDSLLVVQSPVKEITFKNNNDNFSVDFPLTLGENVIAITSYSKDSQIPPQQKILKIYYLAEAQISATVQSKTATSSSVGGSELENFKEKLAQKVEELTKKNQKVIAGTIESIDKKKIRLKTEDLNNFDVKFDTDLTKFYMISGADKVEKAPEDFESGDYVITNGPQVDKTVEANAIYIDEQFLVDFGKVVQVNSGDNSLQITTGAKNSYVLDIENTTRQQMMDIKTLELDKTGFSKIKEGDYIHFAVKKETDTKDRYAAFRLLLVPQEYFVK